MNAARLFKNVPQMDRRSFLTAIGAPAGIEQIDVPAWVAAAFHLYQILRRAVFVSPEARTVLLDAILPALKPVAATWEAAPPRPTTFTIATYDARFITWTGRIGFLDLRSGEDVPALAGPAGVVLLWDLSVIFGRRSEDPDDASELAAHMDSA